MTFKALGRRLASFGSSQSRGLTVLMYHRIAEPSLDPWDLSVSPANFAEHMDVLGQLGTVLPVRDLVGCLEARRKPESGFAITFDDGYADNLHLGLPVLERLALPATVFLVTNRLGGCTFWWDELDALLLQPVEMPPELRMTYAEADYVWRFTGSPLPQSIPDLWRATDPPSTERRRAYMHLWSLMIQLESNRQEELLAELREALGRKDGASSQARTLTEDEATRLGRSELIEIGAHTASHPSLPDLAEAGQRRELVDCKKRLESLFDRAVLAFAYPYGRVDNVTSRLAQEVGFDSAFTTDPGRISRGANRFALPRLQVVNGDGESFARQLAELH